MRQVDLAWMVLATLTAATCLQGRRNNAGVADKQALTIAGTVMWLVSMAFGLGWVVGMGR